MPYGTILTVACIILAFRFALMSDASLPSRGIVVGLALGSFFIPWLIAAILTRLAVSLYVLLYLRALPPGDVGASRRS